MKSFQTLVGLLLLTGTSVAAGHALTRLSEQATSGAAGKSSQASMGTLPKDIYPETGNRFPAINAKNWTKLEETLRHAGRGGFFRAGGIGSIAHPWLKP